MCTVYYDSRITLWSEREVTRCRKEHVCSSCTVRISIGSPYVALFCVSDGEAFCEDQCMACCQIAREFSDEHGAGMPFPSSLLDYVDGCADSGDARSSHWEAKGEEIRSRRAQRVAHAGSA